MSEPVIALRHVSKTFRRKGRSDHTVLSRLTQSRRLELPQHITALNDVSFDVFDGEILGIVGDNAAGKSTLLRIIGGMLEPDTGKVIVRKPITSILQIGAGLRHQLTVRDNITLVCSLYGMSQKETKAVFDDIITFGELEEYTDMFTYQLSTGYQQRLAFSIAVHSSPQILLLDEVFSAGDKGFQKKAHFRMKDLIHQSSVTVIMSSHNLEGIERHCDRAVWLDRGTVREIGSPTTVVAAYRP